jgi:Sec-independent protein secretion pathway component TatC
MIPLLILFELSIWLSRLVGPPDDLEPSADEAAS